MNLLTEKEFEQKRSTVLFVTEKLWELKSKLKSPARKYPLVMLIY